MPKITLSKIRLQTYQNVKKSVSNIAKPIETSSSELLSAKKLSTEAGIRYFSGSFSKDKIIPSNTVAGKASEVISKVASPINNASFNTAQSAIQRSISDYVRKLKNGERIDPEKIQQIFERSHIKGKDVRFNPRADMPSGRIMTFKTGDKKYVLESHPSKDGNVTRLYIETNAEKDRLGRWKETREYLSSDGSFKSNSYMAADTHLLSAKNGKQWISKSPFLY